MGRLLKAIIALVVIVVLALVGLNFGVKAYLTRDRVRSMVIPPMEKALERKVSLGEVQVSIFKGITLTNLAVKEADGKKDFLRVKGFVLKYSLLPILKKQIVITKLLLVDPYIRIYRDARGHFNYESLGPIKRQRQRKGTPSPQGKKGGSPWPLTIKSIQVKQAHLVVEDALGEIPNTDLTANAQVSLSLGAQGIKSFSGNADFTAKTTYGQVESLAKGKTNFTPKKLSYNVSIQTEEDTITLSGQVLNYLDHPSIILDISSPLLHLDKLMSLPDKLPKGKTQDKGSKGSSSSSKKGKGFSPPKVEVKGKINVKEALYKGLKITAFQGNYQLKDGIFSLKEASAKVAEGEAIQTLRVDLNDPLMAYKGTLQLQEIDLGLLTTALLAKGEGMITGSLDSALYFSGKGTQWDTIKRWLSAEGTFSLKKGQFLNFKAINAIAGLLKLKELQNLAFNNIYGTFKVVKGRVLLKGSLISQEVQAQTKGTIGLDGSLNLPMVLKLSPNLGEKLQKRVSFARYLSQEKGWTVVPLKLTGTVSKPVPVPQVGSLKERLKGLLPSEKGGKGSPLQGIKNLFR